jgi:hypothetical protein
MNRAAVVAAGLVLVLVTLDLLLVRDRHGPPGLATVVGIAAAAGIVVVAKGLARLLQRRDHPR